MFEALTPANQEPRSGPNFCPFCDYWHPVASMVTGHVAKEHWTRLPEASRALRSSVDWQTRAAKRAERLVAIRARKTARDQARKDAS